MQMGEATIDTSPPQSRDAQPSRSEPAIARPSASLLDTLVFLLTIGAVVVACGIATVVVLHPHSMSALIARAFERAVAIVVR